MLRYNSTDRKNNFTDSYNHFLKRKLATVKSKKADVSRVSPSPIALTKG